MKQRILARAAVLALFCLAGCGHGAGRQPSSPSEAGSPACIAAGAKTGAEKIRQAACYTLARPDLRAQRPEIFFAHEYEAIVHRRAEHGFDPPTAVGRPARMVGLALSGGGMRANAFHLGILSGLNETAIPGFGARRLLDRIDYISSVSGGTWALAAYLFNDDRCDGSTIFRRCPGCGAINERVAHFLVNRQGEMHRENWRKEIGHDFLAGSNYRYDELPGLAGLRQKPYFIINATHSAMFRETGSQRNFNFQFTRHSLGTVADCRSRGCGDPCGPFRTLHWLTMGHGMEAGFFANNKADGKGTLSFRVNDFLQGGEFRRHLHLADILAASSAVVDKLYGSYLKVAPKGKGKEDWHHENHLRRQYRLSDGGKSDNTGVLPLLERGVDLIVASQIAQDVHDITRNGVKKPGPEFADLETLGKQAGALFGLTLHTAGAKERILEKKQLFAPAAYGKKGKTAAPAGTVLLVKPTYENIGGFDRWLKKRRKEAPGRDRKIYDAVLKALADDAEAYRRGKGGASVCHRTRFPQSPTLCHEYPMDLVRAYYLLGRYVVVERGLGRKILAIIGNPSIP